jgi:hypothetical protein
MRLAPKSWTPVYEDNNACIEWSNNVIGGRERAKHIDIRKHFAHEAVKKGHLRLIRVDTSKQLADIFTKGRHPQQWATRDKSILAGKREKTQGTSILTRGVPVERSCQVEARRPLRGVSGRVLYGQGPRETST